MFRVEVERETDGRWIVEVPDLPGVMVYGESRQDAVRRAQALALRVLAARLEHDEPIAQVQAVVSTAMDHARPPSKGRGPALAITPRGVPVAQGGRAGRQAAIAEPRR